MSQIKTSDSTVADSSPAVANGLANGLTNGKVAAGRVTGNGRPKKTPILHRLYLLVEKFYDQQVSGLSLALLRVLHASVLLVSLLQLFYFRNLTFDPIPNLSYAEIWLTPILIFWIFNTLFLLLGAFTRVVTIINYALTLAIVSGMQTFQYHLDYVCIVVGFLFMFAPISRVLSLDRLWKKLKYSTTTREYIPPAKISALWIYTFMLMGLGLIYFDSMFHKVGSWMWMSGLGLWLPASLPEIVWIDATPLLNQELLMKFLGYLTVAYEFLFIFLIWFRWARWPLLIVGLGLHLGIGVFFPILLFALVEANLFVLLVPDGFFEHWFDKLKSRKPRLAIFYDEECPLCNRTRLVVEHFDVLERVAFKALQNHAATEKALADFTREELVENLYSVDTKGRVSNGIDTYQRIFRQVWAFWPLSVLLWLPPVKALARRIYGYIAANRVREVCNEESCGVPRALLPATRQEIDGIKILNNWSVKKLRLTALMLFFAFVLSSQMICTTQSRIFNLTAQRLGRGAEFRTYQGQIAGRYTKFTTMFFGIQVHGVFMYEDHFENYNHLIGVTYLDAKGKETWLPMCNQEGTSGFYAWDRYWLKWVFRTSGRNIDPALLRNGIERYTAFWATKNGIDLNDATFLVKVKKIDTPTGWEKDFLRRQHARPWISGGQVRWINKQYHPEIKDIESL